MAQANTISRPVSLRAMLLVGLALVVAVGVALAVWRLPHIGARLAGLLRADHADPSAEVASSVDHDQEHGREHGGHDDPNALELSEQARRNIGLKTGPVKLQTYERSLYIPGIVVERPGQSALEVTALQTGVVTRVYVTEGEAVAPRQPLFDLRMTHEDVVQAQADFLKTAEELDVLRQEVQRLEAVTRDGAVAGKTLLERKYEQQKQEAALRAQREALVLHGLSKEQVAGILETRRLLPSISVLAPEVASDAAPATVLQVQKVNVARGQHASTGDSLAVLADHAELLIEGRTFEEDAAQISQIMARGWRVAAVVESEGGGDATIDGLQILYLGARVDHESRALHFYVNLPNELIRDSQTGGRRYVVWRFKPGQRMQIRLPIEKWQDRIVLPIDAIAQDGAETYVFRANGQRLVRQAVHVEYRDQYSAVIASDGSLYPGDEVALNAAHQLLVALKNKSGGGIDPHAGHSH
ncbi:MAG: efflux RND transporter periplasmic adaptor subunit [Pirellulales bacterium]